MIWLIVVIVTVTYISMAKTRHVSMNMPLQCMCNWRWWRRWLGEDVAFTISLTNAYNALYKDVLLLWQHRWIILDDYFWANCNAFDAFLFAFAISLSYIWYCSHGDDFARSFQFWNNNVTVWRSRLIFVPINVSEVFSLNTLPWLSMDTLLTWRHLSLHYIVYRLHIHFSFSFRM